MQYQIQEGRPRRQLQLQLRDLRDLFCGSIPHLAEHPPRDAGRVRGVREREHPAVEGQ